VEDHTGTRIILDTITAAASFTSELRIALGAPAFIVRVYYRRLLNDRYTIDISFIRNVEFEADR